MSFTFNPKEALLVPKDDLTPKDPTTGFLKG